MKVKDYRRNAAGESRGSYIPAANVSLHNWHEEPAAKSNRFTSDLGSDVCPKLTLLKSQLC